MVAFTTAALAALQIAGAQPQPFAQPRQPQPQPQPQQIEARQPQQQTFAQPRQRQPQHTDTAGAYLDARAAELVALARTARSAQQATLEGYSTLARERWSALLRVPGRDRLLYRRELAAQLDWQRAGPSTATLLGAREYVPVPGIGVRVLEDAAAEVLDVVFLPEEVTGYVGLGSFSFGPHPLRPGAEADYLFRSGESGTITLPDGRSIVLHELVVIPRRGAPELVSGTIWLEDGTGRPVREGYRRAAQLAGARPVPVLGRVSMEASEILIEHALWELRWWLPRTVAIAGVVRVGRALVVPFSYERSYADYELRGTSAAAADTLPPPAPGRPRQQWRVAMPDDHALLLTSRYLPVSIFDEDAGPVGLESLAPLRGRLDEIELPRSELAGGRAFVEFAPLDEVRYNEVEGLSFVVRTGLDIAGVTPFAEARFATAGRVLRGQLGVEAHSSLGHLGFAGYHRVQSADPLAPAFGAGNTLSTFLLGADHGQYHAARGTELVRASPDVARAPWTLRLYAEQQEPVVLREPFTLADIFNRRQWVRAGVPVRQARQYGLVLDLVAGGGIGPESVQWRLQPHAALALGDFGYGQASIGASIAAPLARAGAARVGSGLMAALEAAGGVSGGTLPGQALWYLGGPATMRGYPAASAAGEHFWRARAELSTTFPVLRGALFADLARTYGAGGFEAHPALGIEGHPTLASWGVGASFLEGLVRVDLARAIRFRPGWRLHIAVDNVL
jgi:hypothetical protein